MLWLLLLTSKSIAQDRLDFNNAKKFVELNYSYSLKENFKPVLPFADNFYKTYGNYTAIEVQDFKSYTTLAPKVNYEVNAIAGKQFKNVGLQIELGLSQIAYSVRQEHMANQHRFSDQIAPDKGFVGPTTVRLQEIEMSQQMAFSSIGFHYFSKRKKWSLELGTELGYAHLLNIQTRLFTHGGSVLETELVSKNFTKGTLTAGTTQKIVWMVNKNIDFVIGIEQQWIFRLTDNKYKFENEDYVNDGMSRFMSKVGLRYVL